MANLSLKWQKLIAVTLALFLVMGVFVFTATLVNAYLDRRAEISGLESKLRRIEKTLESEEALQQLAQQQKRSAKDRNLFLGSGDTELVAAKLQDQVSRLLQRYDARLIRSQQIQVDPLQGALGIGLKLQLQVKLQDIVRILHELEENRPLLFLDSLSVTISRASSRLRVRGKAKTTPELLDVNLDIVGYQLQQVNDG